MEYCGVFSQWKLAFRQDGTSRISGKILSLDVKVEWKIMRFIGEISPLVSKVPWFFSNHGKEHAIAFHIRVHIGNNWTVRLQRTMKFASRRTLTNNLGQHGYRIFVGPTNSKRRYRRIRIGRLLLFEEKEIDRGCLLLDRPCLSLVRPTLRLVRLTPH